MPPSTLRVIIKVTMAECFISCGHAARQYI